MLIKSIQKASINTLNKEGQVQVFQFPVKKNDNRPFAILVVMRRVCDVTAKKKTTNEIKSKHKMWINEDVGIYCT